MEEDEEESYDFADYHGSRVMLQRIVDTILLSNICVMGRESEISFLL